MKVHLKMSPAKWRPLFPGEDGLNTDNHNFVGISLYAKSCIRQATLETQLMATSKMGIIAGKNIYGRWLAYGLPPSFKQNQVGYNGQQLL